MNAVKHQHYVPQFYLRLFSDEKDRIHVYDKKADKAFLTNPRNVAGERYFYDCKKMEELYGDAQAIEKYLANFETQLSPRIINLVNKLRTNNYIRLHRDTRGAIAIFIAIQSLRSKEKRLDARQMGEFFLKFLQKNNGTPELTRKIKDSLSEEADKEFQANNLLNVGLITEMASIVESHIWIFKEAPKGYSFWASDQPITKRDHIRDEFRSNAGIASPGIEMHLPLSPTHLLACYERKQFRHVEHLDGKVVRLRDSSFVDYFNQFQVLESLQYVFTNSPDFDLAKRLCENDPGLRNPDRRRFITNHDDILDQ